MGLTRTVEPAQEPIDLNEAKLHLKEDLSVEDSLITAWIKEAREACENYTLRALVTQTWALTIDYDWPYCEDERGCRSRIVLPRPPVASVTSITYKDASGNTQTLDPANYVLFKLETGEWAIEEAYGVTWPSVREQPAAITVTFVAGVAVASVPEVFRSAMKLIIAHRQENRSAVNVGNITSALPLSAQWLLDPMRMHPSR